MEKKVVQITCDVEADWGGRARTTQGIMEGLPKILKVLDDNKIKAIFFISVEMFGFLDVSDIIEEISKKHIIGSHGFHHISHKNLSRKFTVSDIALSNYFLDKIDKRNDDRFVRLPKFSKQIKEDIYSSPKNHTSLLRNMWYGQPMRKIFYMHPFDIVRPKTKAPSLFCKLWYSQPERAYETFKKLVREYS